MRAFILQSEKIIGCIIRHKRYRCKKCIWEKDEKYPCGYRGKKFGSHNNAGYAAAHTRLGASPTPHARGRQRLRRYLKLW